MANNVGLANASKAKKDEFYTQLTDIEVELKHYKKHFKGKTVFCNCDDPYESNFFKYFAMNFNYLGLKKLIATCYNSSPVSGEQLSIFDLFPSNVEEKKYAHKIEVSEVVDINGDGAVDLVDVEYLLRNEKNVLTLLEGDGDFRSQECVEILKEADIIVTNPPFSLFREYIGLLVKNNKQFLIIGNQNAITYKEIFPLIKEDKLWLGVTMNGSNRYFRVPDDYPLTESTGKVVDGKKYAYVKNVVWFTNLDVVKRHEKLDLYKKYSPEKYPKYANYDGIDVAMTADIPEDYYGVMGVPVTFLHKYNAEQFEIIGCADYTGKYGSDELGVAKIGAEWIQKYREQGGRGHYTANMTSLVYYDNDGKACNTFKRILIRRKQNGN